MGEVGCFGPLANTLRSRLPMSSTHTLGRGRRDPQYIQQLTFNFIITQNHEEFENDQRNQTQDVPDCRLR